MALPRSSFIAYAGPRPVGAPPAGYVAGGNLCAACGPGRRAIGEPGEHCERCGAVIRMTDVEVAEQRALRNFIARRAP